MKLFISHASEDKDDIARPLANELLKLNYEVWYDEYTLTIGDDIRKSIDNGLKICDFGIVILSENFFKKKWTQLELEGLTSKEIEYGKTILPIWHNIGREIVNQYSPSLANKIAANSNQGVEAIIQQIIKAITKKKNIEENQKYLSNKQDFINIINIEIDGESFIEEIKRELLITSGINETTINKVALFIDQGPGRNEIDKKSGIYFTNGFKIPLTEYIIESNLKKLLKKNLPNYKIFYWVVDSEDTLLEQGNNPIENCYFNIVAYNLKIEPLSSDEAFEILNAFIKYLEYNEYINYVGFFYDNIFMTGDLFYTLSEFIINQKNYVALTEILFGGFTFERERLSFLISKKFIENLSNPISVEEREILEKLYSNHWILNDYWKDKIKIDFLK